MYLSECLRKGWNFLSFMIDGITIEIMEDIDYIIDNCILYTKFDYVMNKTYFCE